MGSRRQEAVRVEIFLSAANPKNFLLIVARATLIEATDIPGEQEAIVLPIFVVIASSGWAPVVLFARARRAFTVKLDQAKTWMSRNNAAITGSEDGGPVVLHADDGPVS